MTALKTDQLLSTLQEGQSGHCYTEVNICVWPFTFKQSAKVTKNGSWGEGVIRIRINLGVIGDVPAGTQGLHGEIMGGAELDVISLVVGGVIVVVGHVGCLCCCCHCWCPSKQAGQARSRQAWR